MDGFNPIDILNDQLGKQETLLNTAVADQAGVIRDQRKLMLENLHNDYLVERKYVEQTPMEVEQRNTKLLQLNQKYELKMNKIDQSLEPHIMDLEQKSAAAKSKLMSQRQEGTRRLAIVQGLIDKGLITDQTAAIQEQLQTVGISMPITAFRQPTQKRQLGDIQSELSSLDQSLKTFLPRKSGKPMLDRQGNLLTNALFSFGGESDTERFANARQSTPDERTQGNQLLARRRELLQEKNDLLLQNNVGPLQRSMATAGNMQGSPFSKGVASQIVSPMPKRGKAEYAMNKQTGKRLVSYDGRKTWQPVN
jgi:hypothetical protein